jgi:hypothetical protein
MSFPFLWLMITEHPQGRLGDAESGLFEKYAPKEEDFSKS